LHIRYVENFQPDSSGLLSPIRMLLGLAGISVAIQFGPPGMLRDLLSLPNLCHGYMNRYWTAALALTPELSPLLLPDGTFDPGEVLDVLIGSSWFLRQLFSSAGVVSYGRFCAYDHHLEPLGPVRRERFAFAGGAHVEREEQFPDFLPEMTTGKYLILDYRQCREPEGVPYMPTMIEAVDGSWWEYETAMHSRTPEDSLDLFWRHFERTSGRSVQWVAFDTQTPPETDLLPTPDFAVYRTVANPLPSEQPLEVRLPVEALRRLRSDDVNAPLPQARRSSPLGRVRPRGRDVPWRSKEA
jgi:hypothetical protein